MDIELEVALRVARAFDVLGLRYLIGGSLASSLHGVPRSSHDADLVAELPGRLADDFAGLLASEFYVDADMIRDAVRRVASFNVIHHSVGDDYPRRLKRQQQRSHCRFVTAANRLHIRTDRREMADDRIDQPLPLMPEDATIQHQRKCRSI